MRVAAETLLGSFLREIYEVAMVRKRVEEEQKLRHEAHAATGASTSTSTPRRSEPPPLDLDEGVANMNAFMASAATDEEDPAVAPTLIGSAVDEAEEKDQGGIQDVFFSWIGKKVVNASLFCFYSYLAWIPGQGVRIDYSAIIEILIQQIDEDRM